MKIKSVGAYWMHIPIPPERQHVSDFERTLSFDGTIVRIKTECGTTGWGEAKAQVRALTDIPIASGESEFTRHDFRDLAVLEAVDIMQPDLAICGGITEAMRISAVASAFIPEAGAASLGRGAGLCRRAACRRRFPGRVHRRIFLGRQPAAARPRRGEFPGA